MLQLVRTLRTVPAFTSRACLQAPRQCNGWFQQCSKQVQVHLTQHTLARTPQFLARASMVRESIVTGQRADACSYYHLRSSYCSTADTDDDDDDGDVYINNTSSDADENDPLEVHRVHCRLPLRSVALGDGFIHIIAYEDGDTAWSAGLSDGLYNVLTTTRKYKREVAVVALGRNQGSDSYKASPNPEEVWFMRRDTGTTYMGSGCDDDLRDRWDEGEGDDRVVRVAFAPNNGWYLLFTRGGGASWDNLPHSLSKHLDECWDKEGGVDCLSVGHNGEWFVLCSSGRYSWQGVHPTLGGLLRTRKVAGTPCVVEWVELGPDGTFVALFNNHTV